jgi:hypothetical protein
MQVGKDAQAQAVAQCYKEGQGVRERERAVNGRKRKGAKRRVRRMWMWSVRWGVTGRVWEVWEEQQQQDQQQEDLAEHLRGL